MKNARYFPIIIILVFLLTFAALPGMAAGQSSGDQRSYRSVTKIDLGISSLTLEVGESYTFNVSYEPENTAAKKLYASFGFIENGEMDGDEIVAVLKL